MRILYSLVVSTNKNYTRGIIFSLINCLSLGILGIVDKIGILDSKNPLAFSIQSLLFSLIFTIIFALVYFRGFPSRNIKNLSFSSFGLIILIGIFASGIFIFLRFLGLTQSTGTFATLSQIITTSLTAILAFLFLKEKLSKPFWGLFLIIILAMYFVSVGNLTLASVKNGDTFILFSTIFLAASNIFSRTVVTKVNPVLLSFGRFFFGFIFLLIVSFFLINQDGIFSFSTAWVILSGLLWSVGVITFNLAIKQIGIVFATTLLMTAPVITMILEYFLLNYHFNLVQIIAALVVIASGIAVIFVNNSSKLK